MADVFISYTRSDRERVREIADAIERAGFSVWWDPTLLPGDDYRDVIERELNACACAIVCWSETSVKSRWVRDEAEEALAQEKLVPINLDGSRPPLGFRGVQAESFEDWDGSADAEGWRRLILQVTALARGEISGALEPETLPATPEAPKNPAEPPNEPPAPIAASTIAVAKSPRRRFSRLLMLGFFAAAGALLYSGGGGLLGGYWASVLSLAILAYVLFDFADADLPAHHKAIVSRWLAPTARGAVVNTPRAFLTLFEAVFGERHFTRKCFLRSVVASIVFQFIFIAAIAFFAEDPARIFRNLNPTTLAGILFLIFVVNVLGDYISLWETRLLLRWAASGANIYFIVILDAALTLAVFLVLFALSIVPAMMIADQVSFIDAVNEGLPLIQFEFFAELAWRTVSGSHAIIGQVVLVSSFLTTFITSIWLWLALLLTPVARVLTWSEKRGPTFFGRLANIRAAPVAALGAATALLILAFGVLIWGAGEAIALFEPLPPETPAPITPNTVTPSE